MKVTQRSVDWQRRETSRG